MSTPPPEGPQPPGPPLPPTPAYQPYPVTPPVGYRQPSPVHTDPHGRPQAPKTMAGWALGLAIVPCCGGITTLVGVGLAIAVLVRGRDGRDHGKGLAIAALAVAAAWLVVGVVAVVLGVVGEFTADPDRDDDGRVTSAGDLSVMKIRVGDCFDYPELAGGDTHAEEASVRGVPCAQPHQFEAYHEFDLPGDEFPGASEVERVAGNGCFRAFKGFVGIPYGKSDLEPYFLHPTATSWRLLDDRSVMCLLTEPGTRSTGTLEGSKR